MENSEPITVARDDYEAMLNRLQILEAQLNATPSHTVPSTSGSNNETPVFPICTIKPVQPTAYNGVKDYATLENWISSVDSYFVLTNARPPQVYYYINTILVKDAAIWYRYHYKSSQAETLDWPSIREAMRNYFTPPNRDRRLLDQWANLRQTTSVVEYVAQFLKLAMQVPNLTADHLLDKFLRGLKPKTRMELELKDPKTVAEAIRLADRYDAIMFTKTVNLGHQNSKGKATEYEPGGEPMQLDALHTGAKGKGNSQPSTSKPPKDNTPALKKLTPEERDHLRNIGACFKCRKAGHMAKECPANSKNLKTQ
jgi:hypothetical protein